MSIRYGKSRFPTKPLPFLWDMDAETVAKGIGQAHDEISILQYNAEYSLSCTIMLAYCFTKEYYTIIREVPTGKSFADICLIPRPMHRGKPAVVIELKKDKDTQELIEQIRYPANDAERIYLSGDHRVISG